MMHANLRLGGLAAAALLVAAAPPASAQTTLRYKFKQDEKLDYTIENKMTLKVDAAAKEMSINQIQDVAWRILSVDGDGKAKIAQKLTRIRFSMDKVEYDSKIGKLPEGPVGDAVRPVFQAMSGLEITMTVDARGDISEVKVPEKLLQLMKGPQVPGLGDMFSEDGLKRMMAQSGLPLPKDAVAKGKTWSQKLSFKAPFGEMKMDNVYTYEGQVQKDGRKLEQISMKPNLSIESDPNVPAMKLKAEEGKGTAYFDADAGRLVEMTMTQNLTMEAGGQSLRILQNIVTKLKQ